jgi:hypothetical protein
MSQTWKLCSSCKKPINYGATWYKSSVSTCNRTRTALYFCTIDCWQAHVPGARHRDDWADRLVPAVEDASTGPVAGR